MNSKPITKYESVIVVTPFIVGDATKWINAMIVVKSYVLRAVHCCRANSVGVGCVKTVRRRVDGESSSIIIVFASYW